MSNNYYSLQMCTIMFEDARYDGCDAFDTSVTGYKNRTLIFVVIYNNICYFIFYFELK